MGITKFGPLQKGSLSSFEFGVYGLQGGLNVKAVPQMVGDNDLTQAYNVYLQAQGGLQMRNGMNEYHTVVGDFGPVQGLARFYQTVNNGAIVAEAKYTVAEIGGVLYNADTNASLGNIGTTNALPWSTVMALDPNDPNTSSGNTQVLIMCTGHGGPYVWDGATLYTPSGWANAAGARWCCIVNGIVYFSGIELNPYIIYGTGDGIIESFETLPGYRVFNMTQPVAGLCAFGTGATASLVVGMNQGLCSVYGTGPGNYLIQDVPAQDGVQAGNSMVYENGVVYFLGSEGIYTFDGFDPPVQISQKVEPWILNDPYIAGYPMTSTNRQTSFAFVYRNRYYLGYCSGTNLPNTVLVYDLIVKGWTVLQTTPGINCAAALNAPSDGDPFQIVVGSSSLSQVYNWDVEPIQGQAATDDGSPIISQFQTKYYKVGVPGTNKALFRIYPEFFLAGPLLGSWIVQTDYGTTQISSVVANPVNQTGAMYDVSFYDEAYYVGSGAFVPYGAPTSRIDFPGTQGDSFAFGFINTSSVAPYQFGGLSGVLQQRGRT